VLQLTCFGAILVLDESRREANRIDCCPCVQVEPTALDQRKAARASAAAAEQHHSNGKPNGNGNGSAAHANGARPNGADHKVEAEEEEGAGVTPLVAGGGGIADAEVPALSAGEDGVWQNENARVSEGCLRHVFREYYAPFLLHRSTKIIVVCAGESEREATAVCSDLGGVVWCGGVVALALAFAHGQSVLFIGLVLASLSFSVHDVQMGLDQRTALPRDSYLQSYFDDLTNFFRISAPVYFVVDSRQDAYSYTNWALPENQQRVCGGYACSAHSLMSYVSVEARNRNQSFIYSSASSWIDDYITWVIDPSGSRTSCPPPPLAYVFVCCVGVEEWSEQ
jgi:hypothetical protein